MGQGLRVASSSAEDLRSGGVILRLSLLEDVLGCYNPHGAPVRILPLRLQPLSPKRYSVPNLMSDCLCWPNREGAAGLEIPCSPGSALSTEIPVRFECAGFMPQVCDGPAGFTLLAL